jgi:hypothetical protein
VLLTVLKLETRRDGAEVIGWTGGEYVEMDGSFIRRSYVVNTLCNHFREAVIVTEF